MFVCNLLYTQEWGHSRCAYYCYLLACCAWFILWGDRGEGWGALSNEAPPPHPRKRTHFVCSWVPEWAAGGASPFFSFSSHFMLSGSAGQDPYPNVFISSSFAGMPFLVSGVPLESKFSSTFHACLSRSCLESTASALASSECVCVVDHVIFLLISCFSRTRSRSNEPQYLPLLQKGRTHLHKGNGLVKDVFLEALCSHLSLSLCSGKPNRHV